MDYSSISNLPNIGPGTTDSASTKKLQDWLVQNGFMSQADMNTGPGIYGPKTTAAVAKWQSQAGFNTQGNPGWFGPLSKTYIQQQTVKTQTSTPTKTTAPTPTQTPTPSPQLAEIGAIGAVNQQAIQSGQALMTAQQAWDLATKDPNIVSKYADVAKMDAMAFQQQLQQSQQLYSTQAQQTQTQFENERKALAEKQASMGTAYSGFRGQAQQQLQQQESGIVTSARSKQQASLNELTSLFESRYGTAVTPLASLTAVNPFSGNVTPSGLQTAQGGTDTLSGQQAGGITGSATGAQQSDISNRAAQISALNASPV